MVLLWSYCSHHACFKSLFRSPGEHDLSLSGRESPVFLSSRTRCRFAPSCLMQELCPPSPIYPPWNGLNNTLLRVVFPLQIHVSKLPQASWFAKVILDPRAIWLQTSALRCSFFRLFLSILIFLHPFSVTQLDQFSTISHSSEGSKTPFLWSFELLCSHSNLCLYSWN